MSAQELEIALIRASWQGALAVVFVALLCLLPRLTGAIRTTLWRLVLLKFVAALLLSAAVALPVLRPEPLPPAARFEIPEAPSEPLPQVPQQDAPSLALAPLVAATAPTSSAPTVPWWLVGYGLGVVVLLGQLGRQALQTRRWRRATEPITDVATLAECARLARALGLRRTPALRQSRHAATPALTGIVQPGILLPETLLSDPALLRLALAHELAHARRGDLAWNLLGALLRIVFWFHPLAWWAVRELAVAQEQACDALAVRVSAVAPAAYGRTLLTLAQPGALRTSFVSGSADHLKRRLKALKTTRYSPLLAALCLALTGCALVPWQLTVARSLPTPRPLATPEPKRTGTATISGQVRFPDGRPGAKLRVWCNLLDELGQFSGWAKATFTTESCTFSLTKLPAGTYRVCVETAGKDYTTRYKPAVTVKEGATKTDVDLWLQTGRVIEGVVRDLQDKPLPGVWVGGGPVSGGRRDYTTYNATDANGHYRIRVPFPDALIQLRSNPATGTLLDREAQAQIAANSAPRHDFQVAGRARQTLSAFLKTPDGAPIVNAEVVTRLQRSKTDDRGYFQVKAHWGESEAPEEVLVRQRGSSGKVQLIVGQEQTASVTLQEALPAIVTGQVVDEEGKPIKTFHLAATISIAGKLAPSLNLAVAELYQGQDDFTLTIPSDCDYQLDLHGFPASFGSLRLTQLRSGERRELGKIVLQRGTGVLSGVLRDGAGQPLAQQLLRVRYLHAERGIVTGYDGTFQLTGLPDENIALSLDGRYKLDPVTVLPGGPALRLFARRTGEPQLVFQSYTLAQQEAKRRGVPLFVFLSTRTCINCRDIESRVLSRPEVQSKLEGMVFMKLDADQNSGLARQLFGAGPLVTPQFALVTPDGNLLAKTDYLKAAHTLNFVQWLTQRR